MAVEVGINADAKRLGDTGAFMEFGRECGAVLLIDDRENKIKADLRKENATQIIIDRDHYPGWEGRWRDCPHNGAPQTPQRLFEVMSAHYNPVFKNWTNVGNEPARGNDKNVPEPQRLDELKKDIEFYQAFAEIAVRNKFPVVLFNIQIHELTARTLPLYKALFKYMAQNPQYLAMGWHQYFALLLWTGIGTGNWNDLLNFGLYSASGGKLQPPQTKDLYKNAAEAHIGRDVWIIEQLIEWGCWPMTVMNTEMGFDRIHNIPQMVLLDNVAKRPVRGLQTLFDLLGLHFPGIDAQLSAADIIIWMCKTLPFLSAPCFYNWTTEEEWFDYSCAPYAEFRKAILKYNHEVRSGMHPAVGDGTPVFPPKDDEPTTPPPTIPPVDDSKARLAALGLRLASVRTNLNNIVGEVAAIAVEVDKLSK